MALPKIAVDSAAEQYWADYFGDYGKQFVRSIPMRVAASVGARTAAAVDRIEQIVPLSHATSPVGLRVEGRLVTVRNGGVRVPLLFAATFSPQGDMLGEIETIELA